MKAPIMIRPMFSQEKKKKPSLKKLHSKEELAQLNLIQISNSDFYDPGQQRFTLFSRDSTSTQFFSETKFRRKIIPTRSFSPNKSVEMRRNFSEKMENQLNTNQVCILKRKPTMSQFVFNLQKEHQREKIHRPKPFLRSSLMAKRKLLKNQSETKERKTQKSFERSKILQLQENFRKFIKK